MPGYFNPDVGHLHELRYSVNYHMEGQVSHSFTIIPLLRLVVSYIKKTYPYVKTLKFTDNSYRECDIGSKVDLPEMACITGGKTLFEIHFGAYPDLETIDVLQRAKDDLQRLKDEIPWNHFKHLIYTIPSCPEADVEVAYEKAATLQDFFLWVRGEIGVPEFCAFLFPWLHGFFCRFISVNVTHLFYMLPIQESPVEAVDYEESPFRGGGKRPTRRAPKLKYVNYV